MKIDSKRKLRKIAPHFYAGGLLIAVFSLVFFAGRSFAQDTGDNIDKYFQIDPVTKSRDFKEFLAKILDSIVYLATPFLVIMFIFTSVKFVTARGNAEALGKAKQSLLWTIVGTAVVLGAKGISNIISNTIGHITQ